MKMEEKLNEALNAEFRGKELRGASYDELYCDVLLMSAEEYDNENDSDDDDDDWEYAGDDEYADTGDSSEYEDSGGYDEYDEYGEYGDDDVGEYDDEDDGGEYISYEDIRLNEIMSINVEADDRKLITDVTVGFRTVGGEDVPENLDPELFFTYERCFDTACRFVRSILKK